ncbi:hypothetical protein QFZ82_001428 [Streptomyces sp. V4I23]|nr:hypothetical protein [Streptomyces sp. V4I23]
MRPPAVFSRPRRLNSDCRRRLSGKCGSSTALQGVSRELFDAARLNGASERRIVLSIKIPHVQGGLVLTGMLSVIQMLQIFNEPALFRNITPQTVSDTFTPIMIIYNQGFNASNYQYAAPLSVLLALILGVASFLFYRLASWHLGAGAELGRRRFWMIYSVVRSVGTLYFDLDTYISTATDVSGAWTAPRRVAGHSFDPALFHDDGRLWLLNLQTDHRPGGQRFAGIVLTELDRRTLAPIGDTRLLLQHERLIEGPKLLRRNG